LRNDNEYRYEKYDGAEQIDRLKQNISKSWHNEGQVKMREMTDEEVEKKMKNYMGRRERVADNRAKFYLEQAAAVGLITDGKDVSKGSFSAAVSKQASGKIDPNTVPLEDEYDDSTELAAGNYHVVKTKSKQQINPKKLAPLKAAPDYDDDSDVASYLLAMSQVNRIRREQGAGSDSGLADKKKMVKGDVDLAQRALDIIKGPVDDSDDLFIGPHGH